MSMQHNLIEFNIFGKYRKFKSPKVSYIFEKTLVLSIICSKLSNKDEKIFKEEESIKIWKFLGLNKVEQYDWWKQNSRI